MVSKRRRGTPEWALFFTDAEWREFEGVVRAEITPRGISGDIREGTLTGLERHELPAGELTVELFSLTAIRDMPGCTSLPAQGSRSCWRR